MNKKSIVSTAQAIGHAISVSRRAKKMRQADLASEAGIGMNTMVSIEKGETTVQLGHYLSVLSILSMDDCLKQITGLKADTVAIESMANNLPKRVIGKRVARKQTGEQYLDAFA